MDNIRIGRVSSTNPSAGMVSVKYDDKGDDGATDEMPYFSLCGIYSMPKKDQMVIVLHMSTGGSVGVVLGRIWNEGDKPPVTGDNTFWMDLLSGACLMAVSGAVTLKGSTVTLSGSGGTITVSEIISTLKDHEARISALGG